MTTPARRFFRLSFNFLASLINGNEMSILAGVTTRLSFNFLASLINGNFRYPRWDCREVLSTFNFLASLINGNAYAILKSIMPIRPFNFLASLINGNVGVVAAAYKQ